MLRAMLVETPMTSPDPCRARYGAKNKFANQKLENGSAQMSHAAVQAPPRVWGLGGRAWSDVVSKAERKGLASISPRNCSREMIAD